jgi:WD40 repeat protein
MDVLLSQGSGILSKILEIKSINSDMFHSLSGLTGALAIMTNFVEKRVLQGNMIEDAMISQITGTLSNIDKRLNEFKTMYEKTLCMIPYAKLWVTFGPLVGMGSSRILTQLKRLEGDLKGDIELLDLYLQSNQALSLFEISGEKFVNKFNSESLKKFWIDNFEHEKRVSTSMFADSLERTLGLQSDMCAYVTSKIAKMGEVDVDTVINSVGKSSLQMWIASMDGTTSAIINAHSSEITCLEIHRDHLVSGSIDGIAKVFHVQRDGTPLLKTVLVGHTLGINDISCEGVMIATASDDGSAKVWNMMNGTVLFSFEHGSPVKAVFFSGGNKLVTATNKSCQNVTVYDLDRDGIVSAKLYGHVGGTTEICVFGDDVVTTGHDRSLKTWNVHTGSLGQEIARAQNGSIGRMATERFIVTNHAEIIKIWDRSGPESATPHFVKDLHTIQVGEKGYANVHDIHIADDVLYVLLSNYCNIGFENTKILLIDPKTSDITTEFDIQLHIEDGEYCATICGLNDMIYVGTSKGRFIWFRNFVFKGSSCMGMNTCVEKTSSLMNCVNSKPLLCSTRSPSYTNDHFIVGKHGFPSVSVITIEKSSKLKTCWKIPFEFSSNVSCVSEHNGTFLVGCTNGIYRVSLYSECVPKIVAIFEGVVGSMFEYKDNIYAHVTMSDPKRLKHGKSRIVKFCKQGNITVIARDVNPVECNISSLCNYLIYPSNRDGEICVYDMDEDAYRPPIKYTGDSVVTHIRTTGSEIWTVHGRMDIKVWVKENSDITFKCKHEIALSTEVSDLFVSDDNNLRGVKVFSVAMLDGTVNDFVLNGDKLQTRVRADHTSGPVALVSGVSLGSEMRMSYISTKIPVNQLIADKSLENADEKKVSGLTRALSSFFGN